MVIMIRSGLRVMGVALIVAAGLSTLGCAGGAKATDGPAAAHERISKPDDRLSTFPEADGEVPVEDGPGSALAAQVEASESDQVGIESSTLEGTDSEATVRPSLDPELESKLALFGQTYLAYDYRLTSESRLAPIEILVAPDLYVSLITPLPAALNETLTTERRIVKAEFLAVEGIDSNPGGGGIYQLSFLVSETSKPPSGDEELFQERTQSLTVVVGPDGLIEDVR